MNGTANATRDRAQGGAPRAPNLQTRLNRAVRNGRDQVSANPLAAVIGAAAVSAGLALLLPASKREIEMMGDVADKIGEAARDAADSAVEAGKAQVQTLAQTALAGVGGAMIEQVVANANGTGQQQDAQAEPTKR